MKPCMRPLRHSTCSAKPGQDCPSAHRLFSRFKQLQGYNASKDILRGLRTPFAFAVLAFLLHILSVVLDIVELDTIAYGLSYVATFSALLVALWAGLNYSGQYPSIIETLNTMGDHLWTYGKDGVQMYLERQAGGAPAAKKSKKD